MTVHTNATPVLYQAPDEHIDPEDTLTIEHDLVMSRASGEACLVSVAPAGVVFASIGESVERWRERRKETRR